MTDRAQSNFVSGVPDSAWYTNHGQVCHTTGFSLLANLQQNLRDTLAQRGPLPTSGGSTIAASQLNPINFVGTAVSGDGWTTDTLRALYALAPAESRPSIQNDLQIARFRQGNPLSTGTMQAAIWFAFESGVEGTEVVDGETLPVTRWGRAGTPAGISLGDNPVMPGFGQLPEIPANGVLETGRNCEADNLSGANAPLHTPSRIGISDVLIALGLLTVAAGAALLTRGAPTRAEQRAARQNPSPQLRYAIATKSRNELIALLKSENPRGLYRDDERIAAGMYPLTHTSASGLVFRMVS